MLSLMSRPAEFPAEPDTVTQNNTHTWNPFFCISRMDFAVFAMPLLLLLLLLSVGFFELFPRPGWVDASIYSGYILNRDLMRTYDLGINSYQGARLSLIIPARLLGRLFGAEEGRLIYLGCLLGLYAIAVGFLTRTFIRGYGLRLLVTGFLFLNPLLLTALVFGGADGPCIVYQVAMAASLTMAFRLSRPSFRYGMAAMAGVFLAATLSAHVFAIFASFLILAAVCFLHRDQGRKALLHIAFAILGGFVLTISLFGYYGLLMGLKKFYLLYNIGWGKHSLSGKGISFLPPFEIWLEKAAIWLPIIGWSIFTTILLIGMRQRKMRVLNLPALLAGWALLTLPLVLHVLYDVVVRGSTLITPSYYNLTSPAFFLGVILIVHAYEAYAIAQRYVKGALIVVLVAGAVTTWVYGMVKPVYASNAVNSREVYRSQIAFYTALSSSTLKAKPMQFVFYTYGRKHAANPLAVYSDHFKGAPRYFDYMDSLVGLYIWNRSSMIRIEKDVEDGAVTMQPQLKLPVVYLAANREDVAALHKQYAGLVASDYVPVDERCYESAQYPWCYVAYDYQPSAPELPNVKKSGKKDRRTHGGR